MPVENCANCSVLWRLFEFENFFVGSHFLPSRKCWILQCTGVVSGFSVREIWIIFFGIDLESCAIKSEWVSGLRKVQDGESLASK